MLFYWSNLLSHWALTLRDHWGLVVSGEQLQLPWSPEVIVADVPMMPQQVGSVQHSLYKIAGDHFLAGLAHCKLGSEVTGNDAMSIKLWPLPIKLLNEKAKCLP